MLQQVTDFKINETNIYVYIEQILFELFQNFPTTIISIYFTYLLYVILIIAILNTVSFYNIWEIIQETIQVRKFQVKILILINTKVCFQNEARLSNSNPNTEPSIPTNATRG